MLSQYQVVSTIEERNSAAIDGLRKLYGCRVSGVLIESVKFCFEHYLKQLSGKHYEKIAQASGEDLDTVIDILNTVGLANVNAAILDRKALLQKRQKAGQLGGVAYMKSDKTRSTANSAKTKEQVVRSLDTKSPEFLQIIQPRSINDPVVQSVLKRLKAKRHKYANAKDELELFRTFWKNEMAKLAKALSDGSDLNENTPAIINYYCEAFRKDQEIEYLVNYQKDYRAFSDFLDFMSSQYGPEDAVEETKYLIDIFFDWYDDFVMSSGYTIGVFISQYNRLRTTDGVVSKSEELKRQREDREKYKKMREEQSATIKEVFKSKS